MMQLDLFTDSLTPENIKDLPIASRDDVLKCQTAILFNPRVKVADRIKAAELISKMQGYFNDKSQESDESPQPVEIVFTMKNARAEPPAV